MENKSIDQVEKNVSASFGFVKKDLLMVNDAISNLQDQIQHLVMNNRVLLGKFEELQRKVSQKNKSSNRKK